MKTKLLFPRLLLSLVLCPMAFSDSATALFLSSALFLGGIQAHADPDLALEEYFKTTSEELKKLGGALSKEGPLVFVDGEFQKRSVILDDFQKKASLLVRKINSATPPPVDIVSKITSSSFIYALLDVGTTHTSHDAQNPSVSNSDRDEFRKLRATVYEADLRKGVESILTEIAQTEGSSNFQTAKKFKKKLDFYLLQFVELALADSESSKPEKKKRASLKGMLSEVLPRGPPKVEAEIVRNIRNFNPTVSNWGRERAASDLRKIAAVAKGSTSAADPLIAKVTDAARKVVNMALERPRTAASMLAYWAAGGYGVACVGLLCLAERYTEGPPAAPAGQSSQKLTADLSNCKPEIKPLNTQGEKLWNFLQSIHGKLKSVGSKRQGL